MGGSKKELHDSQIQIMNKKEKSIEFAGRKLTLSTGHIAGQATSAVMAQYGETVCLVTVMVADIQVDMGYFPLQVEYQEKLFAGGRIKGSRWVKRDGRPTDDEILTARLIDRSIRPLFPSEYMKDVQVIVTLLSVDMENSPDMVACVATSAALAISSIPWDGPVGTVRLGLKGDDFVVNPLVVEQAESTLDLVVSTTKSAVVMIEAGANEVGEDVMTKAVEEAHSEGKKLVKFISDFAKEVGVEKEKVEKRVINEDVLKKVRKDAEKKIEKLVADMAIKKAGYPDYDALKNSIAETFEDKDEAIASKIAFEKLFNDDIRIKALSGTRVDGRKKDELRSLSAGVAILPRTHGSGLFMRGQTQALTVTTLGPLSLGQLIETPEGEEDKRYIHHYSMPPFSVGETGKVGSPKRREIGHGALAERALTPVIPSKNDFPYAIHVVTEILSGNGSTSMASVCGSTLSLMDAGVPIKAPVAGIAMGVVIESPEKYTVLTDIVGVEDGGGDMDFKVAGTKNGITALQLDVKTLMLTPNILSDALKQAKKARLEILAVMDGAISKPNESVSKYAPKITMVKIDPEKIGELIGPSGKTIKRICAETGAQVEVDDDGNVSISAVEEDAMQAAVAQVQGITKVVKQGEVYEGKVTRIENFGAFAEILPNKQGLIHISDMSSEFVNDPNDVVDIGQTVTVKVKEVDDLGRINLTMNMDDNGSSRREGGGHRRDDRGGGHRRDSRGRGGYRDSRSGSQGGNNRKGPRNYSRNDSGQDGGGPHFPASRLMDTKDFSR